MFNKKDKENRKKQSTPIFTYLCSSIGESLDINRFETPDENDLADAAYEYHSFSGNPNLYMQRIKEGKIINLRLKILDIDWFLQNIKSNWVIDNNWSDDEKIKLGIKEEEKTMNASDLSDFIDIVIEDLNSYKEELNNV